MFEIAVHGPTGFKRHAFDKQEIVVGSSRSNDLTLRHKHVSRRHARFFVQGGFCVEDLGSKNGTYVNGERVEGVVMLRAIDDIDIGPFTLTLVPLNQLGAGSGADERPVVPAEDKFIGAIKKNPSDPTTRVLYADWLAGQGEELKAEILRMQEKLRNFPLSRAGWEEVAALLAKLPQSELWWRILLARSPIESCGTPFASRCPKNWDALRPTDQSNTRTCDACRGNVLYAITIQEAQAHVKKGGRVVVDAALKRTANDLRPVPRRS